MQQIGLKRLARDFSAAQQIGYDRLHAGVAGRDFEFRLLILLLRVRRGLCMVEHNRNQRFGFKFSGRRERNCRLHNFWILEIKADDSIDLSSIVGATGKTQAGES